VAELPPGLVTVADLYREMVNIREALGEVATGIKIADERHQVNQAVHTDYETRIRALERGWWKISGAAAVISLIVSFAVAYFTIRGS